MTEEILQSAILKLRSKATEQFAIIKDLYHRPATPETVDKICNHALLLAQCEGGVITLQQYATALGAQTDAEAQSNVPEESEEEDEEEYEKPPIRHGELVERSPSYRKSLEGAKLQHRDDDES